MNKKKSGAVIVFLASLLWAGDAPFRKPLLVGGLGTGFVAFLEHMFNGLVSLPGLIRHRADFYKLDFKKMLGLLYIGAGASALAAILFVQGAVAMNYNFTVAALLQKFQPLFAILLAAVFLKEKISLKFWLLVIPALLGGYLISFGAISPLNIWEAVEGVSWHGPALAVLAALLWAGGTVVGRALLFDLNFQFVTGLRFVLGFVFLLVYVLAFEKMQFGLMSPYFWRNTIIISLLTGFFALLLYYFGLKNTKASTATLMELGYPLALSLINWKFLGIALGVYQIAGAIILLGAVTALVLESIKEPKDGRELNP
ncbi:MAG: DMT family transporter [Candidatus Doudnabacteria bacterium]|nr:DMT family transporter [Candidatus Doudnabacteria bacterium]